MGRPIGALWAGPAEEFRLPLAVLAACFLAGGLAGCLLSARTGEMGEAALTELLRAYVAQAALRPAEPAPLAVVLWETFRWPLLVLILGFTTLGLLFLPLVFAVRGFLFSFAVTSFVRMLGGGGAWLALAVFGVTGCAAIPALFVLGVQGMGASRALASRFLGESRRSLPYGRSYWTRCAACAGVLLVCAGLESTAVPALVSGAAGLMSLP